MKDGAGTVVADSLATAPKSGPNFEAISREQAVRDDPVADMRPGWGAQRHVIEEEADSIRCRTAHAVQRFDLIRRREGFIEYNLPQDRVLLFAFCNK